MYVVVQTDVNGKRKCETHIYSTKMEACTHIYEAALHAALVEYAGIGAIVENNYTTVRVLRDKSIQLRRWDVYQLVNKD